MSIYREDETGGSDLVEPDEVIIRLEDGTELKAAMMLDKDGNETHVMFDTVVVLAKHPSGGWIELEVADGSWERFPLH
jgi:hypothetical protein